MNSNHQTEVQMLNEYIVALQKQIKSIEVQRQSLIQEVGKAEQTTNKAEIELRQLKNQFKELNTVLYKQNIEKTNVENKFKLLAEQNQKIKKENQLKEQRINQLNNTAREKTDLLAKQKNNLFLTTTFHTKQITALDDKIKEAERKAAHVSQQKNLAYSNLTELQEQIAAVRQDNEKIFAKTQSFEKENQQLQIRIDLLDKQILEINNQKDLLNFNLQLNNEELTKIRYENENLSMQLIHRSQNNEEAQKSFENFIQNLKFNHEHQIHQHRQEIHQLKMQIQQYKDSIDSLNNLLNLQRNNFEKQYQKNAVLSEDLINLEREIQHFKKQSQEEIFSRETVLASQEKQYQSLMQKWKDLQEELERTVHDKESNEAYLNSKYEAFEMKYADELRKKIDEIQLLNNDFSLKTLELEEVRYELSETQKKEVKTFEEVRKRDEEIDSLINQLSLKSLKIEELRFQVSQVEKKLQSKGKDFLEKERVCHSLLQKQSELNSQIELLKKQVSVLKDQKSNESKKLKKNIEGQDQELIDSRKRQTKLAKQLKEAEEKIAKLYNDLNNSRENYEKKLTDAIQSLNQTEKDMQKLKRDIREKEEAFKELSSQTDLRLKEYANKDQEQAKKIVQLEAKLSKLKSKAVELQKQLEKKDQEFNKTVQKMSIQQNSELHEIKKAYEAQHKQLENKTREQISLLSNHLDSKSAAVKELQLQLNKMQMASIQYSSNQSSMEKTIAMLQKQLDESHKQNNSYHEKLFSINNSADHTKEQLIEKDIKIISLNSNFEKIKKENSQLLNEISMLRTQVDALENSTAYLKRQITSTLDKQQVLLKEIRSLKEANKEMTKVVSSNSNTNLFSNQNQKTGSGTPRAFQKAKSFLSLGDDFKEFKNLSFKDIPTITEASNEGRSRATSVRKRQIKSLHKNISSPSVKTLHSAFKMHDHAISIRKDNIEEVEMIPESSMTGSINSSFYKSSHQVSRKISDVK